MTQYRGGETFLGKYTVSSLISLDREDRKKLLKHVGVDYIRFVER